MYTQKYTYSRQYQLVCSFYSKSKVKFNYREIMRVQSVVRTLLANSGGAWSVGLVADGPRRSVDYRGSERTPRLLFGADGPDRNETEAGHVIASTEAFIKYSYSATRRMRRGHQQRGLPGSERASDRERERDGRPRDTAVGSQSEKTSGCGDKSASTDAADATQQNTVGLPPASPLPAVLLIVLRIRHCTTELQDIVYVSRSVGKITQHQSLGARNLVFFN